MLMCNIRLLLLVFFFDSACVMPSQAKNFGPFQTFTITSPTDENQTDEQKTPLLSPTDDIDVSIAEEIALKDLNVETAFHDNTVEPTTPPVKPEDHSDQGCFRTSHSNQDLQREAKSKDVPVKSCVVECENGQKFIADHVIMTASLGKCT